METKEYLEQVFNLNQKLDLKMEKLAMLQAAATKITSGYSATRGGSGNYQKMENNAVKIVALEEEISKDVSVLQDIQEEIEKTIKLIGDEKLEFVLMARYIYLQSWSDIASNMNYSIRYVMKMHEKAISQIEEKVLEKEQLF